MKEIVTDLVAEREALDRFLATLADEQWDILTPADGWTIKDSVFHLAYIDDVSVRLIGGATIEEVSSSKAPEDRQNIFERGRRMKPLEIMSWWRETRDIMVGELFKCSPERRIPWQPWPMAARTFTTARLMETWAHGLDCFDAIGAQPEDTDRLRHIALLAYLARSWAYKVNNLVMPQTQIRLELRLPSGTLWTRGPEGVENVIRGQAREFCRVAVRRGHWRDTNLVITGDESKRFLEIVQAYAGQPGSGRKPKKASES